MLLDEPWAELVDKPVYVLTADQDWAPEWAMGRLLDLTRELEIPLHVFMTNPSPTVAAGGVDTGIHPNFLPGSTHGVSTVEVIRSCFQFSPSATTSRTHCYAQSTSVLRELRGHGVVADSSECLFLQPGITPTMHGSGLFRIPVFLEDDVLMDRFGRLPRVEALGRRLFTPGLKVLDLHPSHVGLNTSCMGEYDERRHLLFEEDAELEPLRGYGVRDLLADLAEEISARGLEFMSFEKVVHAGLQMAERALGLDLLGWQGPASPELDSGQ